MPRRTRGTSPSRKKSTLIARKLFWRGPGPCARSSRGDPRPRGAYASPMVFSLALELVGAAAAVVAAVAAIVGIVVQRRDSRRRALTAIIELLGEIDVALRFGKPQSVWEGSQRRLRAQLSNA